MSSTELVSSVEDDDLARLAGSGSMCTAARFHAGEMLALDGAHPETSLPAARTGESDEEEEATNALAVACKRMTCLVRAIDKKLDKISVW